MTDTFHMIRTSGLIPDSMQTRYAVVVGDPTTVAIHAESSNLFDDALAMLRHLRMNNFEHIEADHTLGEDLRFAMPVAVVQSWRGLQFPEPVVVSVVSPYADEGE